MTTAEIYARMLNGANSDEWHLVLDDLEDECLSTVSYWQQNASIYRFVDGSRLKCYHNTMVAEVV